MGQITTLFILVLLTASSRSELSIEISNTILKMHTLKTDTEDCKNKYQDAGRYVQRVNDSFSLGLMEKCSNCQNLTMEQHLIRIHKIVTKFVQPLIAAYQFEKHEGSNEITQCVAKVQHVIFTLKILIELQVPATKISQHSSESVSKLKFEVKHFLEGLQVNTSKQVSENDVMAEFSSMMMKELFVTAIVIQKDRLAIQKMA